MSRSLLLKFAILASFSLLAAACGDDEKAGDACDSQFVASCDGNATQTCENGKIVKTDCADKSCEAGVCIVPGTVGCGADYAPSCKANTALTCEKAVVIETDCGDKVCKDGICGDVVVDACDDKYVASCDGNATLTCVNDVIAKTDCGDKVCKDGVCGDVVVDACDADYVASCEGNATLTCVENVITKTDCGVEVCQNGACVDLAITECAAGYVPVCEGNATLTCVENVITKTDCGATAVCTDGACRASGKPVNGAACIVSACDGKDMYNCYSKKYKGPNTCTNDKICSVDKDGYGSCVATCTEAKKGDAINVCNEIAGAQYVVTYVCGMDTLGNYVYDDDIDNTDYVKCAGACTDGACVVSDKPKAGDACTTSLCIGNDVYRCFSKKYKSGESCASGTVCSVDAVVEGFGSCLIACTEAKKGDVSKVCEDFDGTNYVVTYVCGLDALGNYVYDDDIDNTDYVKCTGACTDGACL